MAGKIQKIVRGVRMHDTLQEGIEEALEKQDAIDKIEATKHSSTGYLEYKKTTEARKKEIEKKIERDHKKKLLEIQQAKYRAEQSSRDDGRGRKTPGVVTSEESSNDAAADMPPKELTEEARQQLIIDYLDEVMQLPEFWKGRMEKPDEKPQRDEIELLERRTFHGIMGYLIRNKTTGKKFFIPNLHNLNNNIADKLPAAFKINFKLYNIS
ncbi:MAG: hypothetical protein ACLQF0_14680 [Dissulfurispiraceae bacterium]